MSLSIRFSHFGLFVTDLDRMVDFYTGYLGFVVSDRGKVPGAGEFAFLTRDPTEHHQIVMCSGRPKELPGPVVQQISFRVDDLATLRKLYAMLQTAPVSFDGPALGPISHTCALSIYFADPDGNRVELFVDTPWFITQPTRVPLDLSLDDDALMQSIEAYAKRQPGYMPREEWEAGTAAKLARAQAMIEARVAAVQ